MYRAWIREVVKDSPNACEIEGNLLRLLPSNQLHEGLAGLMATAAFVVNVCIHACQIDDAKLSVLNQIDNVIGDSAWPYKLVRSDNVKTEWTQRWYNHKVK